MRIDPDVRALRGGAAPQRHAMKAHMAAVRRWRSAAPCKWVRPDLDRYGAGWDLADCPNLMRAMSLPDRAQALVESLMGQALPALAAQPLGQTPLRHSSQQGVDTLLLDRSGRAVLLLMAQAPGRFEPDSASFSDGERHQIVLAGTGSGRIVEHNSTPGGPRLAFKDVAIGPGSTFAFDSRFQTFLSSNIEQRLVSLRLLRSAEAPEPTRHYRLSDGSLLHQSAGDVRESRNEMMLALLGRMKRRDAAPIMAEIAREGSDHLRWQALRECLALDTATGFAELTRIACDAADSLSGPAAALRAQLVEAYPVLGEREAA